MENRFIARNLASREISLAIELLDKLEEEQEE